MMDLYLMRHGIAEHRAPSDAERALTAEGVQVMRREAAGLVRLGVRPAVILASPLRRAQQTAQIVRDVLEPSVEIATCPGLAFGDHESVLIELGASNSPSALLVGHMPLIGELTSILLVQDERIDIAFETGSVAHVSIDRAPRVSSSVLRWHLTPAQLMALGG